MKITNLQVFNFEGAFRGLRNPLESWDKSDSCFDLVYSEDEEYYFEEVINNFSSPATVVGKVSYPTLWIQHLPYSGLASGSKQKS